MLDPREVLMNYSVQQGWHIRSARVIIDEPNLRRSAKEQLGIRPDLKKIVDNIERSCCKFNQRPVVVTDEGDEGDKVYFQMLEDSGFEVRAITGQCNNGIKKSRTDPYIHSEICDAGFSDTDIIIIVSGDGDFEPTLRSVKENRNKHIIVYSVHGVLSYNLHNFADEVRYIGKEYSMWPSKN